MPSGLNSKATSVVRCDVKNSSIFFRGYIDQDVSKAIQKSVDLICQKTRDGPIYFFINSHGGEANSAFEICRTLGRCPRPIITVAQNKAESAALLLVQMGIHRFASRKISFLIHGAMMDYHGSVTANKILDLFKEITFYNSAAMLILNRSGQSLENLRKILDQEEFYFNSKAALKMGFVDKVLPRNKRTPKQIREYITRYLAKNSKETKPESQK